PHSITLTRAPHSTLVPYTTLFRSEDPRLRPGDERRTDYLRALDGRHWPDALGHCSVGKRFPQRRRQGLLPIRTRRRVAASVDRGDRKSTRLNSSHGSISYAVFCLK